MNEEEILSDPGALIDERSEEEKDKDYRFDEIVAAVEPVVWVEKAPEAWRKFPIFSQNGSGSCVAQTLRKLYGVYLWLNTGFWVDISASHIYQRRANRPAGGMSGRNAFEIAQKGTTLEQFAPSEKMNDSQMDAVKVIPFMEKIGETFKLGRYVTVSPTDIDTVASIIQKTGKAVMVWFFFTRPEWTNMPVILNPNLKLRATNTLRHSVAAVDFCLHQGKKCLIIDDSWGLEAAINGQRVITEEFFNARNFFAAHFQNFAFEEGVSDKPSYSGTIISLQKCLRYEGLFPINVDFIENFGPITKKALGQFQVRHGLVLNNLLDTPTKNKLAALYP